MGDKCPIVKVAAVQAQSPGVPPAIADTTADWHAIEALSSETPPPKKH
jgi:hypothetical protein